MNQLVVTGKCGGNFTTHRGLFTSPSYPDWYDMNEDCIYKISEPNGTYISLTNMTLDTDDDDFLEVRDGVSDKSPLIGKFSGINVSASVHSTGNFMWLR